MKKYIRFFRNRQDTIPNHSYQLLPPGKQNNNSIHDTPVEVYEYQDGWMKTYPNGKVDFICLR